MKDKGFTLIEIMVALLIMSILVAIAAPSWAAFISNRKLNTANEEVTRSLQAAQSEAKRLKRTQSFQLLEEIDPSVQVSPNNPQVQFDYQGNVVQSTSVPLPYRIDLTVTGSNKHRCVVVKTILGAIATGKDATECNALAS